MQMRTLFGAGVLGVSAVAGSAGAAIIATDSYLIGPSPAAGQYVSGGVIRTADAGTVNTGFVNGGYSGGSGTSQFSTTSGGLVSVGAQSTNAGSGKVNFSPPALDANTRVNARSLTTPIPTSSTYWITHVVNRGNNTLNPGNGYVLTGFGNSTAPAAGATTGALGGLFVGFAQNGVTDNFGNLVIRYRDTAGNTSADAVLVNGSTTSTFSTTYLVVAKIDVNVSGGSIDKVSWWLNPTNGGTETDLNATAAATGTFDSYALQSGADFARLNYDAFGYTGTAFFDEPRLSTDLAGLSLAVPEPTTLAAVAGAGLTLLRRRRRA